jgi:pyridoxal phosphate enzyme (YggS family)
MSELERALADRLEAVRARIRGACERAGRAPSEVRLVAVSKFHGVAAMRAAYLAGQREFGENYAQELADKAAQLSDLPGLHFHFIGGLQRNKAKQLVGACQVVETLAGEAAARTLHERALAHGRALEVMLQVNVAGERQKSGVAPEQVGPLVALVRGLSALRLTGLMTIPPADDPERARACYRELRALAAQHGLPELSMGMSDDLEIAIEEGTTNVRVGTAIFGPRP